MRRSLPLLSLLALAVGLELAAGTFSRTLEGFRLGWVALSESPRYGDLPVGFVLGLLLVLTGGGGLAIALWARWRARRLIRGSACPRCGLPTRRVRRRLRHKVLGRLLGRRVSRRLCGECDWTGLALSAE